MISFFTYLGNLSSLEIVNAQQSSGFTGNNLDQQNGNNIVTNSVNQNSGTLNTLGNNNIPTDTQGIDSFVLSGPVSSYIHTQQSDWVVGGNWYLKAQDGNLTNFIVQMKWDPTNVNTSNVKTHYHDFSFFRANPSQNIVLGSKNQTQINGIMDVGLGLQSHNWRNVPAQINTAGNTIKISFDDSKTGGHFDTDYVFGEITDLVNLSSTTDNKTNIIKNPIDNKTKLLNVKLEFDSDPIKRGGKQILTVTTSDLNSNKILAGIHISGAIIPPSEPNALNQTKSFKQDLILYKLKNINTFNGTTDTKGQFTYTWKIDKKFKPGAFTAVVKANGLGYGELTKSSTFEENK